MPDILSRADKTQSRITYELALDETDSRLQEMRMTVLCASRPETPAEAELGSFVRKHVAFMLTYRFSQQDQPQDLTPPPEVVQLLGK